MKKITEVRCSGLSRPMKCPGFLFFENLPAQQSNAAAEEGTAAGELLERKLLGLNVPYLAKNGVPFDNDMQFYTDEVASVIRADETKDLACEQRIDWQTQSGIWIKGSYDISFIRGNKLYVDDLKYGFGIVEPKENWQLLGYAIGRWLQLRHPRFDSIVLRIHQPRPHHEDGTTRTWEISTEQLLHYKNRIETVMLDITNGYNALVTGPQCKYCPAAAMCPAFSRVAFEGIDLVLNDFTQDNIDENEIAKQLALFDRVSDVFKIKQDSLKALAQDRLRNNKLIPGWTTEKSYGNRSWKPFVSPKVIEALTKIKIVEEVMLSPAKAERLGVSKELVKEFVDRPFLGEKLVRKNSSDDAEKVFKNKQQEGVTL